MVRRAKERAIIVIVKNFRFMSKLRSKLLKVFLILAMVGLSIRWIYEQQPVPVIQAAGPVVISFENTPLFNVSNLLPGDEVGKLISIINNSGSSLLIGIRAKKVEEIPTIPGLSQVLDVVIKDAPSSGSQVYYGQGSSVGSKTMKDLFGEATSINPINLSAIAVDGSADYQVIVKMQESAGNEYQESMLKFDLIMMVDDEPIILPKECQFMANQITEVITGTEGNDRIRGSAANELIMGLGGNDRIRAGSGNDCIVGGKGQDHINAGSGMDVILGNEGDDKLDGHSDDDIIYGGPGNDRLRGKHGNDQLYGGQGDDYLEGHADDDQIYGGKGNDEVDGGGGNDRIYGDEGHDYLWGSSGDDTIFGGDGDDQLIGRSGSDVLVGDGGNDEAIGNSGVDTCEAEMMVGCE